MMAVISTASVNSGIRARVPGGDGPRGLVYGGDVVPSRHRSTDGAYLGEVAADVDDSARGQYRLDTSIGYIGGRGGCGGGGGAGCCWQEHDSDA